nr:RNA polymerase sigma-70 factor [Maribellus maritimus]
MFLFQKVTDTELFKKLTSGNKKAFDQLFLRYYKNMCRFSLTFVHDTNDSEELVQKLFVRLWENRKKLEAPEDIKAFLFKSVYYESMKLIREKNTRKKYISEYFLNFKLIQEEPEDYSTIMPYLNKAIQKLPERCKQIFILNKLEGLTQKEIAEYLGISIKTVENQVAIAISKLREEVKPFLHLIPATLLFIIL